MGTPDFAVASLEALLQAGHEVAAVVTATDKPGGRGRKSLVSSPVAEYARLHQLPLLQPEKLRDPAFLQALRDYRADLFVVVAFRMLPEAVWAMPRLGSVNLHGSLLPAYRGAAPIHWAVLNGERETGVTIFFLKKDIDTGDILYAERLPIGPEETTGDVHDRMKHIGARALCRALRLVESGQYTLRPQPAEAAGHAPKIFTDTARLDVSWSLDRISRWIRGMNPYPSAWIQVEGKKLKLLRAQADGPTSLQPAGTLTVEGDRLRLAAADGWLEILELQPEGSRRMTSRDFINGMQWRNGFTTHIDLISIPSIDLQS